MSQSITITPSAPSTSLPHSSTLGGFIGTKSDTLYRWATRKLGPSKCKRIKFCKRKVDWYGCWDWDGTITLNLKKIQSTGTLYRTLAHEWTHAQQMWRDYKKWDRRVPYKENPLEIEARKRERELW